MEGVCSKLEENGYSGSHTFQYAQWEEWWEAGLKVVFERITFVTDLINRILYSYSFAFDMLPYTMCSRSTLHEKNNPLHLLVQSHQLRPEHQTEYHHQALILEIASSIGFKSGEYGGNKIMCTPAERISATNYLKYSNNMCTKPLSKLQNFSPMVNVCIFHHQNTQLSRIRWCERHLTGKWEVRYDGMEQQHWTALTTLCSRKCKNFLHVIEPLIMVLATIPLRVKMPSPETWQPRTKAPHITARFPFLERPQCWWSVRSSVKNSSRKPISSGLYFPSQSVSAFWGRPQSTWAGDRS